MPARKPNRSPESKRRQREYSEAWNAEHYDQLRVRVPKGKKAEYMQLAAAREASLNGLIVGLLDAELEKEKDAP